MTLYTLLKNAIVGANISVFLGAALVQLVLAALWFGCIFRKIVDYHLAADKGVRRVEHMLHRYSPFFCTASTFIAGVARAVAVEVIVSAIHGKELSSYVQAGLMVASLACINHHHFLWCQRPMPLLLADCGHEVVAALLAAVSCFGLQNLFSRS